MSSVKLTASQVQFQLEEEEKVTRARFVQHTAIFKATKILFGRNFSDLASLVWGHDGKRCPESSSLPEVPEKSFENK